MNKYEELKSHHEFMLQQAKDEGYDLECAFQSGVLGTLDKLKKDIEKAELFDLIIKYGQKCFEFQAFGNAESIHIILSNLVIDKKDYEKIKLLMQRNKDND